MLEGLINTSYFRSRLKDSSRFCTLRHAISGRLAQGLSRCIMWRGFLCCDGTTLQLGCPPPHTHMAPNLHPAPHSQTSPLAAPLAHPPSTTTSRSLPSDRHSSYSDHLTSPMISMILPLMCRYTCVMGGDRARYLLL
jgi:hypothetical protein